MILTIGLDLGDRSSFYCVLNRAGEVILEERVAATLEAMKKALTKMPMRRIALETGMHSPWVSRLLTELGHEAIVAHSRNVRLIRESRRKDDRLDAQALARLARIDPQPLFPIQHRSAPAQADLAVIRARYALVRTRTALVCSTPSTDGPRGRPNRWQRRLYRGCPMCTECLSCSPRVRMEGSRQLKLDANGGEKRIGEGEAALGLDGGLASHKLPHIRAKETSDMYLPNHSSS